ncbi:MAG: Stk1 family PASTA domain-containing Ser/Thr kinase [Candidatus Nanopelagicales bacterium]
METTVRDALVGRTVDGRYRIVGRLARGGMATVYEAVDERLDRTVALKVMHPGLAEDPGFVSRFQREAKAAARLADPHVVGVFDQGDDDGTVYLAMEYVPGRTVRDVLREHGPLTPEQALVILEPVLQALEAAHQAGFVHRDVKPENVLISDDGKIKVADFGLARAVADTTSSTTQGMLIGTVAYLSPEQVERGVADIRSDVYGAGILLYEMVTGQVPYAGETPLAVAYQHVNADVPAPSTIRPAIPYDVDALVTRATRRSPQERYPSAEAFLDDVRRVRAGLPAATPLSQSQDTLVVTGDTGELAVAAEAAAPAGPATPKDPSDTAPQPAPKRRRRRRRGLVVGIVFVLLAIAGAAFAAWYLAAGPGRSIPVPGIVGLQPAAATAALNEVGLALEEGEPAYSETVKSGLIISADPTPGTELSEGDTVTVVVSRGPERYDVPALKGKPLDKAKSLLTSGNLRVGDVTEAYDEKIKAGLVVSADPKAGTALKPDTPVDLVVSKGPKPVPVPKVLGTSLSSATKALEKVGLKATSSEEYSTSVATGLVVSANPTPGTVVKKGTTVALVISKGPPPVTVPNVVGLGADDARAKLEAAGLRVQEDQLVPVIKFGLVYSQSPGGGDVVPAGSTITISLV